MHCFTHSVTFIQSCPGCTYFSCLSCLNGYFTTRVLMPRFLPDLSAVLPHSFHLQGYPTMMKFKRGRFDLIYALMCSAYFTTYNLIVFTDTKHESANLKQDSGEQEKCDMQICNLQKKSTKMHTYISSKSHNPHRNPRLSIQVTVLCSHNMAEFSNQCGCHSSVLMVVHKFIHLCKGYPHRSKPSTSCKALTKPKEGISETIQWSHKLIHLWFEKESSIISWFLRQWHLQKCRW
jgi:hypothetical protein